MTQAVCLKSSGSLLRHLNDGGQRGIKMRVSPDRISSDDERLVSRASGGNVVATGVPAIVRKTVGVLGGDARIRDTRIAVWMLVQARQLGMTDEEIRSRYRPSLCESDLEAAWQYYDANKDEIDLAITENEAD